MTESATGPGADLHKAFVAYDLEPAFSLGEVVFYNTKNFFKKHNFGRDVKRFVHQNDWCIYNNKYHLNARGIITLGFAKKNKVVLDLVWKTLCLPACDINLQPNQYATQDDMEDIVKVEQNTGQNQDDGDDDNGDEDDDELKNSKLHIKGFPPVIARDSPRSIGSFESPRSPASGRGTPTSGAHPNHPSNLLKQLHQQPSTSYSSNSQNPSMQQGAPLSAQQQHAQQAMYANMYQQQGYPMSMQQQQQMQQQQHQAHLQQQQYMLQQQRQQQAQQNSNVGQRMDYTTQQQPQQQYYQQQPAQPPHPQVGQKRPMPNEFNNNTTVPRKPNGPLPSAQQRFPGVLPLDLSSIQRTDTGALSSERSAADLSLERSTNFFMMMPDEIVGPPGDYVRDPFNMDYVQDSMPIDGPYDHSGRRF